MKFLRRFGSRTRVLSAFGLSLLASEQAALATVNDPFPDANTNVAGLWLDADRAAQGLMFEQIDPPQGAPDGGPPRVVVSWYTWAPAGDPNPGPRWLFGIGRRTDTKIVVDPLQIARFGHFLPRAGERSALLDGWGRIEIEFKLAPDARSLSADLDYSGPAAWGSGSRTLRQLTVSNFGFGYGLYITPVPSLHPASGTYSDPLNGGQGWVVNQYIRHDEGDAGKGNAYRVESILLWYTYDLSGRPVWMYGIDSDLRDGARVEMVAAATGGTFEAGSPQLSAWGTVVAETGARAGDPGCAITRLRWETTSPDYRDAVVAVGRITRPWEANFAHPDSCEPWTGR